MKRAVTIFGLFVILCLVSATVQAVNFEGYEVEFEIKKNSGEVTVKSGNKNCAFGQGQRKGCIKFPLNSIGLIKIYIGNKNQIRTCADPSTEWVIFKIELSNQGYLVVDKNDPNKTLVSDKGIFESSNLPLPDWMGDAFPQLEKSTGFLYVAPTPFEGMTQVTSLNLNSNNGVEDIWYRVTVAKCESNPLETLVSDPRWENEGKN